MISTKKVQTVYKRKENIFSPKMPFSGLFLIKNGKIKKEYISRNFKISHIVRLVSSGNFIGPLGYNTTSFPITAVALEDSEICFIDDQTVREMFLSNPEVNIRLLELVSKELLGIEERAMWLSHLRVKEKLAMILLYIKDTFGYSTSGPILDLNISRSDLASISGASFEQVVRNLSLLEKEKFISKDGKKIRILNEPGLRNIVADFQ